MCLSVEFENFFFQINNHEVPELIFVSFQVKKSV